MALRTYSRSFCPFRVKSEGRARDDSDLPTARPSAEAQENGCKPKRSKSLGAPQSAPWSQRPAAEAAVAGAFFSKTYSGRKRKLATDSLSMLVPAFAGEARGAATAAEKAEAAEKGQPRAAGACAEAKAKAEQKRRRAGLDASKLHDKLRYFARIDAEQLSVTTEQAEDAPPIRRDAVRTQRTDVEVTSTKLWQIYQEYAAGENTRTSSSEVWTSEMHTQ